MCCAVIFIDYVIHTKEMLALVLLLLLETNRKIITPTVNNDTWNQWTNYSNIWGLIQSYVILNDTPNTAKNQSIFFNLPLAYKRNLCFYVLFPLKALAGLVEIPAIALAIFIIMKVGKKWIFCATFFLAGISCLCSAVAEAREHLEWLKITFLMIGNFKNDIIIKCYKIQGSNVH